MRYLERGLTHHDKDRATLGFTIYSPNLGHTTYVLNMAGEVVHEWQLGGRPSNYGYLLPTGNFLVAIQEDEPELEYARGGILREMDWDGNVLWEYVDSYQHHDFRRCANGNTIYLGWEQLPDDVAKRVKGGTLGSEHEDGIWGDYIREVTPAGETAWEWHNHEHMEVEKWPLHAGDSRHQYAHPNAIFPMENGDGLICFRHIDLVAIVDRSSGKFSWQRHEPDWGGPHDMQVLPNGNMMIFANRRERMPRGSKVVEFDKESGETIWEYNGNPTHTFDSHFISGCQRLDSGNTLICEGLWGRIFEVTPGGDIVWEFVNPHTAHQSRGPSVGDVSYVFRAYRYAPDGPEIQGRLSGKLGD